jgi:capsular polysaccharide biosynthesis protein
MELQQYLAAIKRRVWIPILLLMVAIAIVVVDSVLWPTDHEASFTVVAYDPGTIRVGEDTYVGYKLVMESGSLANVVAQSIDPPPDLQKLQEKVSLKLDKKTGAHIFKVSDPDPERALRLAEAYNREGTAMFMDLNMRKSKVTLAALQEQVDAAEQRLQKARADRATFEQRHELGSLPARLSHQVSLVASLQRMRAEMLIGDTKNLSSVIDQEVKRQQELVDELTRQAGDKIASSILKSAATQSQIQIAIDDLRQQLSRKQDLLASLEQAYAQRSPSDPSIPQVEGTLTRTREEIASLEKDLKSKVAESASLAANQAGADLTNSRLRDQLQKQADLVASLKRMKMDSNLNNFDGLLRGLDAELSRQNELANDLSALSLQYEQIVAEENSVQSTYVMLQNRIADALILSKARPAEMVKLIGDISVETNNRALFLKFAFGVVLSIILGLGLVFAAEYLDQTVRTAEQIEKMVGATVLTTVPHFQAK